MIQSVQSSNLSIQNSTALYNAKVSASSATKTQEETQDGTTTSSQGDTLVISSEGLELLQKTYTGSSADSTEETTITDETAAAISEAASSIGIDEYSSVKNANSADAAAVGSSGSSSDSASDLSQYSTSELKEMLTDGEITRAEYDEEIALRQSGGSSSAAEAETEGESSSVEEDTVS